MKKSYLSFILIISLISSTNASSNSYAPDNLKLTPGSYASGRITIHFIDGFNPPELYMDEYINFSVEEILEFPSISNKLVLFKTTITFLTSSDIVRYAPGMILEYKFLIWQHNRSLAIPIVYIKLINGTTFVEGSLLNETTFEEMSNWNNTIITLSDGRTFTWEEVQSVSSLERDDITLIDNFRYNWEDNIQMPTKSKICLSPEVSLGQFVDYNWFIGEVSEFLTLSIGDKDFDVFRIHIDYTTSPTFSTGMNLVIPDADYYYESETGLIAGYMYYNSSQFPFTANFTVNELHIANPVDPNKNNTFTLHYEYLFSILGFSIVVCLVNLSKKR